MCDSSAPLEWYHSQNAGDYSDEPHAPSRSSTTTEAVLLREQSPAGRERADLRQLAVYGFGGSRNYVMPFCIAIYDLRPAGTAGGTVDHGGARTGGLDAARGGADGGRRGWIDRRVDVERLVRGHRRSGTIPV